MYLILSVAWQSFLYVRKESLKKTVKKKLDDMFNPPKYDKTHDVLKIILKHTESVTQLCSERNIWKIHNETDP